MPGLRILHRRMLGYLRQMFRGPGDQPGVRQTFPRLYDSQLETRRVLNADAPTSANQLLALVLDAGTQANDGRADRFEISQSQNQSRQEITVAINDRQVWRGSAEQLQSLRLQGSSDNDQFTIDPTIQLAGRIMIDGGINRMDAAPDVVIVHAASHESFRSVTVQDQPGCMQLRFALYESATEHNSTVNQQTVWQVSGISQIVDHSMAAERRFELTHRDAWQLSSAHGAVAGPVLQISSADQRYQFVAPTRELQIDSHSDSAQEIRLRDLDLSSIDLVRLQGDRFDSIIQDGRFGSSRQLSISTGSVALEGLIYSRQPLTSR